MSWLRKAIWRHNGLQGHLSIASRAMQEVIDADTTREEEKREAHYLQRRIHQLAYDVRTNRINT